jgi:DNA-binding transcriptional LysR family regulator
MSVEGYDMRDVPSDVAHVPKSLSVSMHQLRLFITLARHRSFTRAGDEYGITQSAVSRSIRELEDEIALRLFDRTTRQVALTDAGRRLLARVAPLVEELEAALRPGFDDESEAGVVQLASSSSLTASVLPALFASCQARYPELSIALVDRPQGTVLQLVRAGEADLGIVIVGEESQNFDELVAEPLFHDPLCALVPARHPLAAQTSANWRMLRGASLLTLDDDTGSQAAIDRALALHEVADVTRQLLAQAASVARMVEAGLASCRCTRARRPSAACRRSRSRPPCRAPSCSCAGKAARCGRARRICGRISWRHRRRSVRARPCRRLSKPDFPRGATASLHT